MSLAPTSTVPLPGPQRPGGPRSRWRGALVAFVVGLAVPAVPAGLIVADRTGGPLGWSSSEAGAGAGGGPGSDDGVPDVEPGAFLAGDRLATSLGAMVAEAGTTQASQLAFDGRQLSVDLLDADTGLYVRHDQYESDPAGQAYSTDLVRQPPPPAVFDLATVSPDTPMAALQTANRSLGNEPEDLQYLTALVERPYPSYGDPLIVVDDSLGVSPRRVWLSLDGAVLRVEGP